MLPFLTVVIPSFNRRDSVQRTLEGFEHQTLPIERFEVVAVLDGVTDGTGAALRGKTYRFPLRILELRQNSGPSAARNHGSRLARGDVVVFVDDDVTPVPEFLAEHAASHEDRHNRVVIGPQSRPAAEHFPAWIEYDHRMLEKKYARFCSGHLRPGPNHLYSGNVSLRLRQLEAAGGFNEAFTHQEDVELGYRLAKLGAEFRFEARARGIHRSPRTYESWYAIPFKYGQRDAQMVRDMGYSHVLDLAAQHTRSLHLLTRLTARACLGRARLERAAFALLKPSIPWLDAMGARRFALALCSVTYNLRYLQGMAEGMGGAEHFWAAIGATSRQP